ncbi:MAG: NAD(P)-dependent oxidoreductase [Verrucomicrobiota bacterium]
MKTILLTGAAGIVGRSIRPILRERFEKVLLADLQPISDLAENEVAFIGDIADQEFVGDLVSPVDGIVHLAGLVGAAYEFEDVLRPNLQGTDTMLEAARKAGIQNFVFASSHHVVGFLRRGDLVDHRTKPRPNSQYALSKAYGEAAASLYADKFGLNCLVIRIGYVGNDLSKERRLRTWISARDLVQMVEIGLRTPDLGYEVVYGVSDNPEPIFDNSNATRLGYMPEDSSIDFVTDPEVLKLKPDRTLLQDVLIGGGFAAEGFDGDPSRFLDSD